MRILARGLTVELSPDDPRARAIEEMIFGLPETSPEPALPPEPPPPDNAMRFWDDLEPLDRRELKLIAEKPLLAAEIERALGDPPKGLLGRHLRIANTARDHGLAFRIRARGRGRPGRRYFLDEETAALVKRLAVLPPLA